MHHVKGLYGHGICLEFRNFEMTLTVGLMLGIILPREIYKVREIFTGIGGFSSTLLFNGTRSFISSSIGSSNGASCHQTEPLPSMIPFPWTVIPLSFVKSSHWKRPLPQALEFVGAMIVPSSWEKYTLFSLLFQLSVDVYALLDGNGNGYGRQDQLSITATTWDDHRWKVKALL